MSLLMGVDVADAAASDVGDNKYCCNANDMKNMALVSTE